ncbi:hypothetical protein [Endozoicomonas atrinae]|uniref:hypothetical protein n=1 Tax=Endozoicomonas atrinae TaxID=1333660 RepID=UPI0008249271|nr:hypothetical protein [Endozoicomonas atrinae]
MYIGPDGRVYQNKFDSLGHGTKVPGYADEQYAINQRLGELRRQQQEYAGQQQQQALNQQQIDQNDLNQFYDRQQRFAAIHGQPYGFGQMPQSIQPGNGMGARQSQQGGQAGYGMPMERRETVQSPLTQDAGKLNRMLQKYHQGQDPRDAQDAIEFINQHPGIKASNVSGIRFNHSDRNEDPMVSLLGDDGNPVKQFYLSSLSNLNNFAGQKKQTFDPGNKVNDPGKLIEQLQEVAAQQAQADVAGLSPKDQKAQLPEAIQDHYGQLMKQYGPRNPGYVTTGEETPNRTLGFDLFGQQQQPQQDPLAALKQALGGGEAMTPPPPPPVTPNAAVPKQGQGYGYPGYNPLNRTPGTFRHFHPSAGR